VTEKAHGLGWGLAVGAACAVLPGIALVGAAAAGGAAGSAIGAITGHVKGGLDNDDLRSLGEILGRGQAGLVVVYERELADDILESIKPVDKHMTQAINVSPEQLVEDLKAGLR
jgi:uncharacterized membrane protein